MARTRPTGDGAPDGPDPGMKTTGATPGGDYTVVARRYRPQRFEDVVGQDHVVEALRNAIKSNRVTHAYLFSGTRGVGKTSIARIFAKCLNCVRGPTDEPDPTCEICKDITAGQDVDVIEIDGASNNGVESVRELRQNAGLRPSRARFKIYYIDEVHMLSTGAFNALLKTLEEPPPHVKFFFATTEANKIPITVLSRCQRYDLAAIAPELLIKMLAKICESEGVEADPEALRVVARRASGSMRDAESLLEQLLSGGSRRLTAESVHQSLGTAPDDRVLGLLDALADRNVGKALEAVEAGVVAGVQPVDVLAGVLDYLRDVLVLAAGADVLSLAASPSQRPKLREIADRMSLDTILAALEILSESRLKLRGSPHGRTIVELALARVARLEDMAEIGTLIARLSALDGGSSGSSVSTPVKKKLTSPETARTNGPPPAEKPKPSAIAEPKGPIPLDLKSIEATWPQLLEQLGDPLRKNLGRVRPTSLELPGEVVVAIPPGYNFVADACEAAESKARIEAVLRSISGRPLTIRFDRDEPVKSRPEAPSKASTRDDLAADPLVKRIVELFEARPIHVEAEEREGA